MSALKSNIGQLPFVNAPDQETVIAAMMNDWNSSKAGCIVHFMYYASLVRLKQDPQFLHALSQANYLLIDGIGMQLYMKCVMGLWPKNLNGTDLSPVLLQQMDKISVPIALYGTAPQSNQTAKIKLQKRLKNKSIYYNQDGFSPLQWEHIQPNSMLMIGMGSPRQELWVDEHLDQIKARNLFVITVGGYLDFASGVYVRAPKWIRTIKLEWAWRTLLHPKRHLRKRLYDMTIFFKPFADRISGYRNHIKIKEL